MSNSGFRNCQSAARKLAACGHNGGDILNLVRPRVGSFDSNWASGRFAWLARGRDQPHIQRQIAQVGLGVIHDDVADLQLSAPDSDKRNPLAPDASPGGDVSQPARQPWPWLARERGRNKQRPSRLPLRSGPAARIALLSAYDNGTCSRRFGSRSKPFSARSCGAKHSRNRPVLPGVPCDSAAPHGARLVSPRLVHAGANDFATLATLTGSRFIRARASAGDFLSTTAWA
jgi:hypothetical protein